MNEPRSAGFSIVEVIIASAILASGTMFVLGGHMNLMRLRQATDARFQAKLVADVVVNAISSATWEDLNDRTKAQAWLTWTRRVDPESDGMANDDEWLGDKESVSGVAGTMLVNGSTPETRRWLPAIVSADGTVSPLVSRLRGLRVYVEYFRALTATDAEGVRMTGPDGLPMTGGLVQGVASLGTTPGTILITSSTPSGLENEPVQGQALLGGSGVVPKIAGVNRLNRIVTQSGVSELALPEDQSIASQIGTRLGDSDPVAVRVVVTWFDDESVNQPSADVENTRLRAYLEVITVRRR